METYTYLYTQLISDKNIQESLYNSVKNKKRPRILHMIEHMDTSCDYLRNLCENYHNAFHTPKEIYDGISQKRRTILVPTAKEQVVHHMLVNVLKPIFMKSLIDHSYGSIPGRGCHLAKHNIEKWFRKDPANTRFCLKMDVRMKDNWQVFPIQKRSDARIYGHALDFMGFKFYSDVTLLRKKIMLKASHKARRMNKKLRVTMFDIRQMMSYYGWMKATHCLKFYKLWIEPYINFDQLKHSISLFDRRKRNVA